MSNAFANQISNKNFLSPAGFKFILARTPKVDFFSNSVSIPEITLGNAIQPTYLKDIPIPGDKLVFGDLNLRFIVDENLENYLEIQKWMRGLGYPNSIQEYSDWIRSDPNNPNMDPNLSDGSLLVYNSNFNVVATVRFKGLFPVSLSTIDFDATLQDPTYVTADVTFKYSIYDIITS